MRCAILSDIHGNLEALQAVAADIAHWDAEAIICLGDTIGYGPNPAECLDWVRIHTSAVLGNAEEAALFDPETGGEAASPMMAWTRAALGFPASSAANFAACSAAARSAGPAADPAAPPAAGFPPDLWMGDQRRRYLEELPRVAYRADALLVHASPRNPLHEYLLPSCVDAASAFDSLFSLIPRWAFVGHTHVAGVFTEDRRFAAAAALPEFTLSGRRALVNVGSVGQPRDGDPRAAYVRWEGDRVVFRRIAYDVAAFLAKARLHPVLVSPQTARWFSAAT